MTKRISIVVASGRGVANSWRKQYYDRNGREWLGLTYGSSRDIHKKLCALGPNPNVKRVDKIIGNKSWTHLDCSGCGTLVLKAVSFKPEYSDDETLLSESCVKAAAAVLKKARKP